MDGMDGIVGTRRAGLAAVLVAAMAGLLMAGIGGVSSALGFELPRRLSESLSMGAEILSWIRWLVVPLLALGVARARDSLS